ncbi:MAG: farnesyl-diphosphate synthase [Verrucomicrobiales bacterium]|jgi:geranylgeranyl diphosphate synthase type II|nr:farnesyl-diphosphate synthase [Verrucomicrobiales bacterium]|tara:strand:- start:23790 stop:24683 length:894 start_codon:yes stop_codon:yes gene_type:complete
MAEVLKTYLKDRCKVVDKALNGFLPETRIRPVTVHEAMRYSIFAGGKRLRPILSLAAAEACGGDTENTLAPAAAVECIHTYSLIHDDLPCMDDDDLRRGQPTSHIKYGEGVAVLAGDALLTIAFEILAQTPPTKRYDVGAYVSELATASGSRHLIGGQILDLEGEGSDIQLTPTQLKYIHESKTAALLTSSIRLGGMSANATPQRLEALTSYGKSLGLAFQIIDDILDVTQTSEKLGKSAGKDEATDKSTYPALFGLEKSRKEAARLTKKAHDALKLFGKQGQRLHEILDYLLDRDY